MKKTITLIILVAILVSLISLAVFAIKKNSSPESSSIPPQAEKRIELIDTKTERDPWEEIKEAIANCKVKELGQAHSRQVEAVLKDGRRLTATEPVLDDIINLAVSAESKCGRIIMWTE